MFGSIAPNQPQEVTRRRNQIVAGKLTFYSEALGHLTKNPTSDQWEAFKLSQPVEVVVVKKPRKKTTNG